MSVAECEIDRDQASSTRLTWPQDRVDCSQPATLTSTSTTGGTTASTSYAYDVDGNMTIRDTATGNQTLTWNAQGELSTITNATASTSVSYLYDADGNVLLQKDPTAATLYLGDEQITLNTTAGTETGVRYYPLPGGGIAVRTGAGNAYYFEITDQRGTAELYLDYTAQTPTWRQFTPYGQPRGVTTTWIDNRGFINKPTDPTTGLTQIGARFYDPATGRFLSPDPVFEATDPLALNGYTYTDANPINQADPTGQMILGAGGEGCGDPTSCANNDVPRDPTNTTTATNTASGDKTTPHNEAVGVAILQIRKQVVAMGVKNFRIYTNFKVPDAAKKCLYNSSLTDCSYGVPDIVGYDPSSDVYYVWEVKSIGQAAKAVPEATWYTQNMRAQGLKTVLGWSIGGPYAAPSGNLVDGPEPGAVVYGKPKNASAGSSAAPTSISPTQAATPTPEPEPAPGPYPGTADQPGLGVVPLGQGSDDLGSLITAGVLAGAGVAGLLGPDEAAAGSAGVAAITKELFDLAA